MILWVIVTQDLVRRELIPSFSIGAAPDFRTLTQKSTDGTTSWLLLATDPKHQENERPVGEVTTETIRRSDGSLTLKSQANLLTGALLEGPGLHSTQDSRLEVAGTCEVSASGNLGSFQVTVQEMTQVPTNLLVLKGSLDEDHVLVVTESPFPLLAGAKKFPYSKHSMLQNSLGPIDMMPGLQVGQRWESQVVNPLSGKVETGIAEVVGKQHIHWNQNPVPTFVVVTKTGPISARTWVRTDGLVIRQELPLLLTRLILERTPNSQAKKTVFAGSRK